MRVSRDPFARTELHAEAVQPRQGETCAWCGQVPRSGKLRSYRTESDGGRVSRHPQKFCSVSCFRSYNS